MTRTLTSRQNPPASGWNSQIVSSRSPRASLIFVEALRRQCQLARGDARAVEFGLRNDRHEDPIVVLVHRDRPILGDLRRQAVLGCVERSGDGKLTHRLENRDRTHEQ
jgi:hypothetical protein